MPEGHLPFGKDAPRDYPAVHKRKGLTRGQKATLRASQDGKCAGCGIKPKRWEYDHRDPLWTGANPSTLADWQALGSYEDCACHKTKTAEEARQRARMRRLRGETGQAARRAKNGPQIKSRNRFEPPRHPDPKGRGGSFAKKPDGHVSPLSKKARREAIERMEARRT